MHSRDTPYIDAHKALWLEEHKIGFLNWDDIFDEPPWDKTGNYDWFEYSLILENADTHSMTTWNFAPNQQILPYKSYDYGRMELKMGPYILFEPATIYASLKDWKLVLYRRVDK